MKNIKTRNEFLNESMVNNDILTLDELKQKYPEIKFTMDEKGNNLYFVRVDIEKQNGEIEYLGALKGKVSKEDGLKFLNNIAKKNYDKYY